MPETVDRLLDLFTEEHEAGETFRGWVTRVGKKDIKGRLKDLLAVPAYEDDPNYYIDWHDAREYSIGDIGVGRVRRRGRDGSHSSASPMRRAGRSMRR